MKLVTLHGLKIRLMYTYMTNIVFRTIIISFKFTFNLNYNILLCYKGNGEFHECTFFIEIYQF